MSWLSDIAGRAESLLNKLDSEAASVLNEKKESIIKGVAPEQQQYQDRRQEHYVRAAPRTPQHLPRRGNVAGLASSSSVPGDLNNYGQARTGPAAGGLFSTSKPPSVDTTPAHFRNASLDHTVDFSIDSSYDRTHTPVVQQARGDSNCSSGSPTPPMGEEHSSYHSRQSSLSSVASYPAVLPAKQETGSGFTALRLESGSSCSRASSSGGSAHLDTYVTVEPRDLLQAQTVGESGEAALLRRELVSLNEEVKQLVARDSLTRTELQTLRAAESTDGGQLSQLQQQHLQLQESFQAKLQQVALLRARVTELEEQLQQDAATLQNCQQENVRLRHVQAEQTALATQLKELEDKLQAERTRRQAQQAQVSSLREEASSAREELDKYKAKARLILASKEQLIDSLKQGGEHGQDTLASSELAQAREELQLSRDELQKSAAQLSRARADLAQLHALMEQEAASHGAAMRGAEEQITEHRRLNEELQQESSLARQEVECLQQEVSRQKVLLAGQLQERDRQIAGLQQQLSQQRPNSGGAGGEEGLQARVRGLTEALLQRQAAIDSLSAELQARTMQLNRTQQQYQESQQLQHRESHSTLLLPTDDGGSRVASLLVESPLDGRVTRRVKRVYGSVDRLSVGLGVLLRRYPAARSMVLLYVLLLHLWVLLVLLTYSPEVHPSGYHHQEPGPQLPPLSPPGR